MKEVQNPGWPSTIVDGTNCHKEECHNNYFSIIQNQRDLSIDIRGHSPCLMLLDYERRQILQKISNNR